MLPCRGQANYGELGYGANGKKSSANPGKVDSLEGVKTQQVPLLRVHLCWVRSCVGSLIERPLRVHARVLVKQRNGVNEPCSHL